ncbi:hypothetical protein EK904_002730 [Melospiza melodia maxima]|nr:hypothetical protein EK904_002730 [Melospiza melodia maxima]
MMMMMMMMMMIIIITYYNNIRDILKSGGSAVDAAIAALICTSVMNPQSSGLGGGVVFTIYNASTGTVEVINARETAPRVFPLNLLSGCGVGFPIGPRWIGVPGELRGYEEAHKRHGRLPWKALFEPTIKLLSEPLVISPVLEKILRHPAFSGPGKSLCLGDSFRWPALQRTLRAVAEQGAAAFYEGEIGRALVEDISKAGSSLSLEDLRAYKAQVSSALNITLNNHTKVFAPGPPMGGAVLMFILKVLEEYKFHKASLATPEEKAETYHYIAEALKFGNMLRPHMSDPAFSEAQAIINKLWFGYDLEHAISAPVMHTQRDSVLFEDSFSQEVKTGLLGRGHKEKEDKLAMNVVQGISKEGKCISAYSDKRKLGKSAGDGGSEAAQSQTCVFLHKLYPKDCSTALLQQGMIDELPGPDHKLEIELLMDGASSMHCPAPSLAKWNSS